MRDHLPAGHDAERAGPPPARPPARHHSRSGAAALLDLQNTAGNSAVVQALQASRPAPGPAGDPGDREERAFPRLPADHAVAARGDSLTVQRKIGFEIETGWYVDKTVVPLLPVRRPLAKYDLVGAPFDGFKVTADSASNGKSEIEFVVDPPVEEDQAGEQRLDAVMEALTALAGRMDEIGGRKKHFTQDKATGRRGDKRFVITPRGKLDGSPQVTMGLSLGTIPGMLPPAPGQQAPDRPAPEAMQPGARYLSSLAARVTGKGDLQQPSDDLRGLVAVIATYLVKGSTNEQLDYPKQIGNLMMARTDFGALFRLLPEAEREILRADPALWVDMVLDTASSAKPIGRIGPDDDVIKKGTKDRKPRELKIRDWLTGITTGEDKLTTAYGSTNLGRWGDKLEEVGPAAARREVGIFEFRASQAHRIPLSQWRTFALEAHRYITRLNGG